MTGLNNWLLLATRQLSKDSAVRARAEIQEHYESARADAMAAGADKDEADQLALVALGDAKTVNCQYKSVLLTSLEARLLGEARWEAKAFCARPWLKRLLLSAPVVALLAGGTLLLTGSGQAARVLFVVGVGTGMMFAAPLLPVYTPSRAQVFRLVKWAVLVGALLAAFGADALKPSWLMVSCIWPIIWMEWMRVSIRRKLRVADWPKHLYL